MVIRAEIADPSRGPAIEARVAEELQPIVAALNADQVDGQVPYSDEELVRRATALAQATDRLTRISALAGRWAPVQTARIWPQVLSRLLAVRDRGNGLKPWLQLLAYPALLVEYAFGLGASIGRRYDNVAIALTASTLNERNEWGPAVRELHPGTIHETLAIELAGAKPRWPLSDHLLAISRPWFANIVPSDQLFEREFNRFEVLLCFAYYDLDRGDNEQAWAPVGRFARHGRWGRAILEDLLKEARQAETTSILLGALNGGDTDRLATTMAGFDGYIRKVLGQVR